MNGVDYSKQLARERENFQTTIKKDREASEKKLEQTEKRADYTINKQSENHYRDRADLEKNYNERLASNRESTAKALEKKNDVYGKRIAEERDHFQKESNETRDNFDRKMTEIRDTYRKNFDHERNAHKNMRDAQTTQYRDAVASVQRENERSLGKFQDQFKEKGSDLQGQYRNELRDLSRRHEGHIEGVYRDEANKRFELKDRLGSDIEKIRTTSAQDMQQMEDYKDAKMGNMQRTYQGRYEGMVKDFDQRREEVNAQKEKDVKLTQAQGQQRNMELRRTYEKQLHEEEMDKRRIVENGSGEFGDFVKSQSGIGEKQRLENKIKKLETQRGEIKTESAVAFNENHDQYMSTLDDQNREAVIAHEKTRNKLNAEKLMSMRSERENAQKKLDEKDHISQEEKKQYDQQIGYERKSANDRMKNLKESFNRSMKALEDSHNKNMEMVQQSSTKDKTEFLREMHTKRNQEVFELKRDFAKNMDGIVTEYEQRLDNYRRENANLKKTLDTKIGQLIEEQDQEIKTQRELFESRRAADLKAAELVADQRENDIKRAMNEMVNMFNKKMDGMTQDHEHKLKTVTNDYEKKLKDLNALKNKESVEAESMRNSEIERLRSAYEQEKNRLVTQYENQISEMRKTHTNQMESMKNYKQLQA